MNEHSKSLRELPMGTAIPPFAFLFFASDSSLESVELARLNARSNLRKELRMVVEEWVAAEVDARGASWNRQGRRVARFARKWKPASTVALVESDAMPARRRIEAREWGRSRFRS